MKLKIVEKKVDELIEYARNPRKNDQAVDSVAASIKEFGFLNLIVIDSKNTIIAGHTRLKALKKLGHKSVPCVVANHLTKEQAKAFRILDNKIAEKADWDFEMLSLELDEIDMDFEKFDVEFLQVEDGSEAESEDSSDRVRVAPVSVTSEQREVFERAVEKVCDSIGNRDISEGRALELISAEYLS